MNIIGLDGRQHKWNLNKVIKNKSSKYHKRAADLLKKLFPFDTVYTEQALPGTKTSTNKTLYCDFFVSGPKILIEVDGEQHTTYTPIFHGNKMGFLAAQKRDRNKEEWAKLNEFTLIRLPWNETDEQWTERINNRCEN